MGRLSSFYLLKYKISKIFQISFFDGEVLVGFGSIGKKYPADKVTQILELATYFSVAQEIPAYAAKLNQFQLETARIWVNSGLLSVHSQVLSERYSRAELFNSMSGIAPSERREKLSSARVCIVGCGGIGTAIATHLVCNGIGSLTLIDADCVEESNLSRQLSFKTDDIGRHKTSALSDYLLNLNPKAKITEEVRFIDNQDDIDLRDYSFGVVSGDKPGTLSTMNAAAIRDQVPIIHASYVNDIACWGPMVVPSQTGCFQCSNHFASGLEVENATHRRTLEVISDQYTSPAISMVTMVASSFAALDIVNYLLGVGHIHSKNQRVGVWTHNLEVETQKFSRNEDCKVCGNGKT